MIRSLSGSFWSSNKSHVDSAFVNDFCFFLFGLESFSAAFGLTLTVSARRESGVAGIEQLSLTLLAENRNNFVKNVKKNKTITKRCLVFYLEIIDCRTDFLVLNRCCFASHSDHLHSHCLNPILVVTVRYQRPNVDQKRY